MFSTLVYCICIAVTMVPGRQAMAEDYVAIIIDDMGNNRSRGERAIKLPGPVTYAVLPHSRFAQSLAESAHSASKEVMLHLPMENIDHLQALGPGGLTVSQPKGEFLDLLSDAIRQVPHVKGLNNHTGSYLTQQTQQMTWLMDDIKLRDLFFIDSKTTAKSVALKIAQEKNLPSAGRDVFLDNDPSLFAIHESFLKLIEVAKRNGTAIAIGHPYEETLTYLERALPHLERLDVKMVSVSTLLQHQQLQLQQANNHPRQSATTSD